ncbi:hypothetical protein BMS3Abin10_01453 [bacterium BMS3Abin10]|nr:hypothetical protein BMS3Abin10_01453 [bacterium BMS3Abin10]GBE39578.1 hypothetical protein BMS3Bbin08_02204 [bacterium BMS3Bbin08]HDH51159.1 hypothetical protein [Nitrospirota bacterium]
MRTRAFTGAFFIFLIMTVFLEAAYAERIITNRTGAVRITKPDGAVLNIGKDEEFPEIPSGAIIEVLGGSMDIAPAEGFIRVAAGNSTAIVEAGVSVTVIVDNRSGTSEFSVEAGEIGITAGNTSITVGTAQRARVKLDRITGIAEVRSIKGLIGTVTVGIRVFIPEGATAWISADPGTRMVHIESMGGTVEVVSLDGKVTQLAEGDEIEVSGYVVGEIQTFPGGEPVGFLPEEPAEPERREGSPFMP